MCVVLLKERNYIHINFNKYISLTFQCNDINYDYNDNNDNNNNSDNNNYYYYYYFIFIIDAFLQFIINVMSINLMFLFSFN